MNKINKELHQNRLMIIDKIKEYERLGKFNENVEDDPPTIPIKPDEIDYTNDKLTSKISTSIANKIAITYIRKLIKQKKLIIKEVIGLENITNLETGCILTCNHFNPYDNFALHEILHSYIKKSKHKFFKVIREGNYSFKGLFGYFFRNCETLPLSSNFDTMRKFNKAIGTLLERKSIILIYPEQAMWWNYKKPRPLKPGAFKYAVKHNVPIVPCFMTLSDSNIMGEDGFYVQEYTIHFSKPLYQNETLNNKDQINDLCERNYNVWKDIYEKTYNTKLEYECKEM